MKYVYLLLGAAFVSRPAEAATCANISGAYKFFEYGNERVLNVKLINCSQLDMQWWGLESFKLDGVERPAADLPFLYKADIGLQGQVVLQMRNDQKSSGYFYEQRCEFSLDTQGNLAESCAEFNVNGQVLGQYQTVGRRI